MRYKFYTFQYVGTLGGPAGQSSPILALMYSKPPSINLPNFVNFVDGVTDKSSKRQVSACIPRGDNKG